MGKALARRTGRGEDIPPFVYRSRGNTAIVGRHAAVFETGRIRLKGWVAWLAWAIIHVYLLVGFQHRIQVSIQWLWRYLTYERGARLVAEEHVAAQIRRKPEGDAEEVAPSRPRGSSVRRVE